MLRDGAQGISPYEEDAPRRPVTAQTRALPRRGPEPARRADAARRGTETAATRVVADPRRHASTPRQVPAARPSADEYDPPAATPRQAARQTAKSPPQHRRSGAGRLFRRVLLAILALVVLAAIVSVVAVELADKANKVVVHYQQVVGNDAQSAIDQVKTIITKYTTTKH
jgi:hypothetical protein